MKKAWRGGGRAVEPRARLVAAAQTRPGYEHSNDSAAQRSTRSGRAGLSPGSARGRRRRRRRIPPIPPLPQPLLNGLSTPLALSTSRLQADSLNGLDRLEGCSAGGRPSRSGDGGTFERRNGTRRRAGHGGWGAASGAVGYKGYQGTGTSPARASRDWDGMGWRGVGWRGRRELLPGMILRLGRAR